MNKDQLTNLLLKLVNSVASAGVAHGLVTNSGKEWALSGAAVVIAYVISHLHIKGLSNGAGNNASEGTQTRLPSFFLAAVCAGALLWSGCAGTSTAMFNSEKLAADTATAAVHGFNQYYAASAPTASPAKLASLNAARVQVYEAATKLAATLAVAETLRQEYNTNTAAASMLQATVDDALGQATNLVWLANYLFSSPGTNAITLPFFSPIPTNPPALGSVKLLEALNPGPK